jgi:hypothetical protein
MAIAKWADWTRSQKEAGGWGRDGTRRAHRHQMHLRHSERRAAQSMSDDRKSPASAIEFNAVKFSRHLCGREDDAGGGGGGCR